MRGRPREGSQEFRYPREPWHPPASVAAGALPRGARCRLVAEPWPPAKFFILIRAGRVDDLGALLLEGADPLVDGRRASAARPFGSACDVKQVVQLRVGELDEQIGEEFAAGFADMRMVERAGL